MFFDCTKEVHPEQKSTLKSLRELVNISSSTHNPDGVNQVQEYLKIKLLELGFRVDFYTNPLVNTGKLLVATLKGKKDPNTTITLVGHADTVGVETRDFTYQIKQQENRIIGPGVADNKAGLLVGLKALECFLKENPNPDHSLVFVSSPNEETGSNGFHDIFREIGARTHFALGLEPALKDGSLISSRSGNRWYKVVVKGKASHSGRFGESHINAAHELSKKISRLSELTNENEKLRVHVGSFSGGNGTYNTICEEAMAMIDVRFPCFEKREALHRSIEFILNDHQSACPYTKEKPKVCYLIEDDCPPLNYNPSHKEFIEWYKKCVSKVESNEVFDRASGGASDLNYFSTPHNFVLDGLGPIGSGLHTEKESIVLSSLYTRSKTLSQFIKHIDSHTHKGLE